MAAIDWDRLDEMDRLLATAFGPHGRAILSQNPTGQMTITRSGIGILKAVYADGDTPFTKTVIRYAETVDETLGDGVKSFVFTTTALLNCFKDVAVKSRICRQLGVLQSKLTQLTIKSERTYESAEVCHFLRVLKTFFYTRLPCAVSSFLASFFHKFISNSLACTCGGNPSKISMLYKDFSSLCVYENGASRPVTESLLKNGFSISGRVFNIKKSGPRRLLVAVFNDSEAEDGKFDFLDVECEINRLRSVLKCERAKNISLYPAVLLLSSQVLSDLTLFNLGREEVGVIHGVPLEEITFLNDNIMSELEIDNENAKNVIVDVSLGKGHVAIGLPGIQQMFICGPTKELRLEYASTCRSALKLLAVASESMCMNGGGHFERTLHKHIFVASDKLNNSVPKFSSRAELLNWHSLKASLEKAEPDELNGAFTKISAIFSCLDNDILDSVLQGILAVPRKLPKDDVVSPSITALEPISLRLGILIHALSAVISLLRCDHVVFCKKPCL